MCHVNGINYTCKRLIKLKKKVLIKRKKIRQWGLINYLAAYMGEQSPKP